MSATLHRHRLSCSRQIDTLQRERVRRIDHESFVMQFGKAPMQTRTTISKIQNGEICGRPLQIGPLSPESGIFVARNAITKMRHQIPGMLTQTATRERRFHNLRTLHSAGKFRR
ncbi:MAG: hypothetical protein EKK36_04205 [Bradyrhizobiaceae bacterium]|nr:MAG: hypothetical protein EKK36_04205 [Bradyrhizobiaceae bacterium]